ncbi:MAG TPA: hypothetical protein VMC84_09510 [Methanocella sp.]|uniref:hypothetical protein n=1 Tax=Methanocella sp. TaxID=2052833 RepID=UPI002D11D7CA|nr:hypothetical protein [Methanocella sp.]HTY91401.1 hypothetical protein [Methanocella sp.]
MPVPNVKTLTAIFFIIIAFVAVCGCDDMYHILETYVPTNTPDGQEHMNIGDIAPVSTVKDVTISGQGNTIVFRGKGPYNVNAHQDYFTLNQGNASVSIDLQGQGFGCTISLDYKNPYSGGTEFLPIHQFMSGSREYTVTKQVYAPYSCKYCLMVNWGGDWAIRITQ